MKHIAITATLLALKTFTFGQIVNDETSFLNYTYNKDLFKNNKIEAVTIESFYSGKKGSTTTTYHFNNRGLLIKQTRQDTVGILKKEIAFVFNSHNDITSRIEKDYEYKKNDTINFYKLYDGERLIKDSSGEIPDSYSYDYNKRGIILKTTIYSNLGSGIISKRNILNTLDSFK